jgi:four helix bundle protein
VFGFEKLDVWQKAVEYADKVYEITRNFPAEERFGLTSQMRQAAVSVSANIAEGSSRSSIVDFKRFIEIAYGSLLETVSELKVAQRQRFVNAQDYEKLYDEAEHLARMLSGLRRTIKSVPLGRHSKH